MQSRREVLRTTAGGAGVGLLAALAGCSDETSADDENGNGTGNESDGNGGETVDEAAALDYTDWIYEPGELSRNSIGAMRTDIEPVLDAKPSYAEEIRSNQLDGYGEELEPEDVDTIVSVGGANVISGAFDPNAVIDSMPVSGAEEYGDYELYEEEEANATVATDGEQLVRSESTGYQSFDPREEIELLIDTRAGDAVRFADESDHFNQIYTENASADLEYVFVYAESAVEDASDDAVIARYERANFDSSEVSGELVELYNSEDGIDLDEIRSQYESADVEVDDISRDGRIVTVEVRVPTDEYLNTDG